MRYIKQACGFACGKMFGPDAISILDRHIPSGKRYHSGAMREMEVM
jgi:hypothetical protein